MPETDTACKGHCCAVFTWPTKWDPAKVRDGEFIADMLIPLTPDESVARAHRFGFDPLKARDADSGRAHFTCRHWDESTRLCTVYEKRPQMCRDYPYDSPCMHGCSFAVGLDIRAYYRLAREFACGPKRLRLIVGLGTAPKVPCHQFNDRTGRTLCGVPLSRARLVWRTSTLVGCRRCKQIVDARGRQ